VKGDAERLLPARIIWGAISFSPALLLLVLHLTRRAGQAPATAPEPTLFYAIAATAVSVAGASAFLPRLLRGQTLAGARLEVVEQVDERDAVGMFRQSAPKIRVFADPTLARARAFGAFQVALIIGLALGEAVALFGFVLGFLGFPLPQVLPFWAVAWLLMLPRFPTAKAAIAPLEERYDAKLL
jgi:hypothetical protein